MNHPQVIEKLATLLPEIQEKQDPEEVLLKYARENNLSPAQLEKFAQVYNTAKTVSYLQKAANRGGWFRVVDTEELIKKYIEMPVNKQTKSASSQNYDMFKRFTGIKKESTVNKVAAKTEEIEPDYKEVSVEKRLKDLMKTYEDQAEVIDEARDVMRSQLKQAVEHFRKVTYEDEDFKTDALERDCLVTYGKQASAFFDALEQELNQRFRRKIARCQNDVDAIKVACDSTGHLEKAYEGIYALNMLEELEKYASFEYDQAVKTMEDVLSDTQDEKLQDYIDKVTQAPEIEAVSYAKARDQQLRDELARMYGIQTGQRKEEPQSSSIDNVIAAFNAYDKGRKSKPGIIKGTKDKTLVSPESIAGSDFIKGIEKKHKKEYDKQQQRLLDEKDRMVLQRLMITDPIISEHSPEKVVEVYNVLREMNPDIAATPALVTMHLREALEYGGNIPAHTAKGILEMAETKAKTERSKQDNKGGDKK